MNAKRAQTPENIIEHRQRAMQFGDSLQISEFLRINLYFLEKMENSSSSQQKQNHHQNGNANNGNSQAIGTGGIIKDRQVYQEQQNKFEMFFDGKLRIFNNVNLSSLQADVLVNFCASDILSGDEIFLNIHENAGDELKNFCVRYQGIGIGSCRLSDAFALKNFRAIAHSILPRPVVSDDLIDLDEIVEFDLMLCYRNALDLTMENGFNSIAFTHPLLYADRYGVAKLAIAVLTFWMEHSPYAEKLHFVSIACPSEEVAQCYMEIIADMANRGWEEFVLSHSSALYTYLLETFDVEGTNKCEADQEIEGTSTSFNTSKLLEIPEYNVAMADVQMLEAVFEREHAPLEFVEQQLPQTSYNISSAQRRKNKSFYPFDESEDPNSTIYENPNLNQFCIERYGFDEMYIREHPDEVYDMLFRSAEGLQLQLSRNLSPTILTIEEEQGGLLRQYRMTTQNREGETLYFRCSRCESIMRYTDDEYRPKITVRDGFIYGDFYPAHHPQCYPVTKEWVILQQLDRQARLSMLEAGMVPQLPGADQLAEQNGDELGITNVKQEIAGIEQPTTSSARTRLKPAVSSARRLATPRQQQRQVANPRFPVLQRNPNEMPVLYKRNEPPENATLRAIRKCENELEGRVNEELDRALEAQENMEYWRRPLINSRLRADPRYVAPSLPIAPRAGRGRKRKQIGHFMELGHEEVVENSEEPPADQQQQMNFGGMEQQQQQPVDELAAADEQLNQLLADEMQPSTSQQWLEEPQPVAVDMSQFSIDEQAETQLPPAKEVNGKAKTRKGIIRKKGGETNLAFDWREADLDGKKAKK